MKGFILWLLVVIAVCFVGFMLFLTFKTIKQLYENWKFDKSNPTLEQRSNRFFNLAEKTGYKPKAIDLDVKPKQATKPVQPHLETFSLAENINIAWEKEGTEFKRTFVKQS